MSLYLYRWLNHRVRAGTDDPRKHYYTLEELEAQWAEQDAWDAAHPARARLRRSWHAAVRFFREMTPRRVVNETVWHWQRARRGWADIDTASVDWYITRVLPQMLDYLAAHNHAWPGPGSPWETPGDWDAHLRDLAARIRTWDSDAFADGNARDVARDALAEFAANLGYYWD